MLDAVLPRTYRDVLAIPQVRSALLLALVTKVPPAGVGVVLTLHVVTTLGHDYARAGLATAAFTAAIALSAPWRGRLLDRVGLRRTIAPAIVVQAVGWSVAPWVGYVPLLAICALTGLMIVPVWAIVRQSIMAATPLSQRKAALSLDSSLTEIAFMVGPAVGAWLAIGWDTRYALLLFQFAGVAGAIVMWWIDPPLTSGAADRDDDAMPATSDPDVVPRPRRDRHILADLSLLAVLIASGTVAFVLVATDLGIVAGLRDLGQEQAIGPVMALWAFGSLLGGLAYGAQHRSASAFWLMGGLAAATIPVALAQGLTAFALLVTVCGVLCAPTLVATVDTVGRLVPESRRGEAIGWHASFMTLGQGVGAPVAGFLIDRVGWRAEFVVIGLLGVTVASVGSAAGFLRRTRGARRLAPGSG